MRGNIFAHILYNLNMEASSAYDMLEEFVNNFVAKHGSRLQKSKARSGFPKTSVPFVKLRFERQIAKHKLCTNTKPYLE